MEIRGIKKKENGMGGLGKPAAKMPIAGGGLDEMLKIAMAFV